MKSESEDIVITANQLNPGAFSQVMLVNKGLAREEDGGVFTPGYAQLTTDDFQLMVLSDRLHFGIREGRNGREIVRNKLGTLIQTLPYTPYTSIGLNFFWQTESVGPTTGTIVRRNFIKDGHPLTQDFQDGDPRFGVYFSKNAFGGRLKLTVLPAYPADSPNAEFLQAAFNYTIGLNQKTAVVQILGALDKWEDIRQYSQQLAEKLEFFDDLS